jgi:hypothetical protein
MESIAVAAPLGILTRPAITPTGYGIEIIYVP